MRKTVVGFGEVLGAVRPKGFAAWGDSNELIILAGGSEANVLAKVSGLGDGIEAQFVTKMKNDLLGRLLRYDMQRYKIGMNHIIWTSEDRNGLCFVEQGLGPLTAVGEYDRSFSAFANAGTDEFDFSMLKDAKVFFISGITPALSNNCLTNSKKALFAAKKHNVTSFIDVNYRNKLWSPRRAGEVLSEMIDQELFTCLVATETDARVVFNIDCGFSDDKPMEELIKISSSILHSMYEKFKGKVPILVLTIRKRITNDCGEWSSVALIQGKTLILGERFDYVVLDRYGAGDSCSAGIIGGYLGVKPDGTFDETAPLEDRIKIGLNLGNRMSVVVQKTVSDLGPHWTAEEYFARIGTSKEISR
jgi:2-dehydro-3-deoxygluconokinase